MEAHPALVRAEGRVELDAKSAIDLDVALVVNPRNTEDDLAFGFADPFDECLFKIIGVLLIACIAFPRIAGILLVFAAIIAIAGLLGKSMAVIVNKARRTPNP